MLFWNTDPQLCLCDVSQLLSTVTELRCHRSGNQSAIKPKVFTLWAFKVLPWYRGSSRTLTVYYGENQAGVSLWQRGGSEFRWEWSSYQHRWSTSSLIGQWIPVGLPSLPTCHSLPDLLSCSPGSKQGQGSKSQSIPCNLFWSQASHPSCQRVDCPQWRRHGLCAATIHRSWLFRLYDRMAEAVRHQVEVGAERGHHGWYLQIIPSDKAQNCSCFNWPSKMQLLSHLIKNNHRMKGSGDWLYNSVDILNTPELN